MGTKYVEDRETNARYLKYRNMVYKRARVFSRKWAVPVEDMQNKGWEIFLKTLERFDECRGCDFGTYLYARLRALDDFGEAQARTRDREVLIGDAWDFSSTLYDSFVRRLEFYDSVSTELSSDARLVLDYILAQGEKVYFCHVSDYFRETIGCTKQRMEDAWAELKAWWIRFDTGSFPTVTPVYTGCEE